MSATRARIVRATHLFQRVPLYCCQCNIKGRSLWRRWIHDITDLTGLRINEAAWLKIIHLFTYDTMVQRWE